ncbi:MAG: glycosyltransferase family 39 protein [Chloroflexota bacterium]
MGQTQPREQRLLTLILILFLLLGSVYALVTPVFEASDELWHYPMVQHLANGNPLPVQVFDPAQAGPWNQEASQPPLYYYLSAALTFWIDTSDMESIRWLNPHVDNGVITPDGNTNLAIHDPNANPWQGTLLAVRLIRLFSVLLSAGTVYLTYRIGRGAAPDRPEIALGAAAVNAFLPMFLFISGAVNNDNLAVLLASLALLLMIRIVTGNVREPYHPVKWLRWLVLGVVIGLAVLTKEGTLGLLPMAIGTAFVAAWQWLAHSEKEQPGSARWLPAIGRLAGAMALVLVPVLLVAGWWYYRNIVLYGDWLGWNAFIAVLGQRAHPASLIQLWGERQGFLMSYWGLFGGVNIPMPAWVYTIFNTILLISVIGFVIYLAKLIWARASAGGMLVLHGWHVCLALLNATLLSLYRSSLVRPVIFGLVQWATTTWSSQGRLAFTAISCLSVLMVLGLAGWLPSRPATVVVSGVAGFMLVVAAAAPFLWIRPAYIPDATGGPLANQVDTQFDDKLRLVGYEIDTSTARPGEGLWVRLEWEVLEAMDRDWSVFVHANDPVLERPIAQRDMFPGQGLLATRLLQPGDHLVNGYYLTVPGTAVAPADLEIVTGLYDFNTGERLPVREGEDVAPLGTVALQPQPGAYPNTVNAAFEQGIRLVGYEVTPRRVAAGETIQVVTYWQTAEPLPDDYTFFGQIVGEDTTRYASADPMPDPPTSAWEVGETYTVMMNLDVDPQTPADVYPLIVGLYSRTADGGFDRLQQVTEDGRLTDDFLVLTPVRID